MFGAHGVEKEKGVESSGLVNSLWFLRIRRLETGVCLWRMDGWDGYSNDVSELIW